MYWIAEVGASAQTEGLALFFGGVFPPTVRKLGCLGWLETKFETLGVNEWMVCVCVCDRGRPVRPVRSPSPALGDQQTPAEPQCWVQNGYKMMDGCNSVWEKWTKLSQNSELDLYVFIIRCKGTDHDVCCSFSGAESSHFKTLLQKLLHL